jgi:two-component system nitrate/nitrite response regulator NarL
VTRPRVLIADDHAPTRGDVREAIEQDGRLEVCAEVADAVAAVETAVRERPDLCILDVRMPGGGLAATWEITARLPETKVVMFTVSADDDDLFAALRAGASGYLLKDLSPARMIPALLEVLDGEAAIPRSLVSRLVATFQDPAPRRRALVGSRQTAGLTSREWQVLDLLRRGLSTAEIAERLFVSRATVRSHVAAVLRKLRVPDRESAIRLLEGE